MPNTYCLADLCRSVGTSATQKKTFLKVYENQCIVFSQTVLDSHDLIFDIKNSDSRIRNGQNRRTVGPSISKSEWSNNQVHGLYQIHKLCAAFNVNQDVKTRGRVGAPFLASNSSYLICSDMPE